MNALVNCLQDHQFLTLFVDVLGWDHASGVLTLTLDGRELTFTTIAHKRGVQVLHCSTDRMVLLNRRLLRNFQNRVSRTVHEHILIFSCEQPRKQVWVWAIRLPDGRRFRHREHPFFSGAPTQGFLGRLAHLRFSLEEEESVTLLDAVDRVRRTLDTRAELDLFARRPRYAERSDALARAMRQGDKIAFHRFLLLHWPLARKVAVD
jgi:hypothetical protein